MLGVHLAGGNRTSDPQWLKQTEVSQSPDGKSTEGRARLGQQLREGLKAWTPVLPVSPFLSY